jgi:hypothetical protein
VLFSNYKSVESLIVVVGSCRVTCLLQVIEQYTVPNIFIMTATAGKVMYTTAARER